MLNCTLAVDLQGMLQMLPGSACGESIPESVMLCCAGPAMSTVHCNAKSVPPTVVEIASCLDIAAEDVNVAWRFERLTSGQGSSLWNLYSRCLQRQCTSDSYHSWGIQAAKLTSHANHVGTVQAAETLHPAFRTGIAAGSQPRLPHNAHYCSAIVCIASRCCFTR